MKVNMILRADLKGAIGIDGSLLHNSKEDLKYFKRLTKNNVVIMGRKTYESLPEKNRPLPDRINIIVSRTMKSDEQIIVKDSIENAIEYASKIDAKIFIIGGAQIYDYCLEKDLISTVYLTIIEYDFALDYSKKHLVYVKKFDYIKKFGNTLYMQEVVDGNYNTVRVTIDMNKKRLSKANEIFVENVDNILNHGYNDYDQKVRANWIDEITIKNFIKKTPAHTQYIIGNHEVYDLYQNDWPIITGRPIKFKKAIGEILWIWRDEDNNLDNLKEKYNVSWWDKWSIGSKIIDDRYGYTKKKHNVLKKTLDKIRKNPFDKSLICNLLQEDRLCPCIYGFQLMVTNNYEGLSLNMIVTQSSGDYIVAGHVNRMQYAALLLLLSRELDMNIGKLIWNTQNLHIYDRHIEIAKEMVQYIKQDNRCHNPKLVLRENVTLKTAMPDDFDLIDYNPNPKQQKLDIAI